ncbi:MAG: class I SAM-dependent methyltransferase [Bacteroidetes bacterium]|nr:class I SAM-dependent methyltransferase [Bacteroidota bacterium]
MTQTTTCPFCQKGHCSEVFTLTNTSGTFRVLECDHCTTRYSPIEPGTIDELAVQQHFFDEDLYTIANLEKVHRYWRSEAEHVRRLGFTGGKILDIGCNTGEFLFCMGPGYERFGIEIADVPATMAEQKGITVYRRPLEELGLAENSFDIVTLYALIEHLNDPRSLLAEIARILKPGGLAVIMTGDWKTTKASMLGPKWHMYIPPLHHYFFSRRALRMVASEFGLTERSHRFSPGGMTFSGSKFVKLLEKISLWQIFSMPGLRSASFYDHYYGYFIKK